MIPFVLQRLPSRAQKPRTHGLTMVMDKGLSLGEVENFLNASAAYVDVIKLGFGSAALTPQLKQKIELYQRHQVAVYLGGSLFEWFYAHGALDQFEQVLLDMGLSHVEVSDGSLEIPHEEKCRMIERLAKKFTVFSEVGSKDAERIIPPYKWIELMREELQAGAYKVIAEAREGGNVGIYRSSGEVRQGLVEEILTQIPEQQIIWEAPNKAQQVFFIKWLGSNVNLGNIPVTEVIALESLRVGLRGDTMKFFLSA